VETPVSANWTIPDEVPGPLRAGVGHLNAAASAAWSGDADATLRAATEAVAVLREPHLLTAALCRWAEGLLTTGRGAEADPVLTEALGLAGRLSVEDLPPYAGRLLVNALNDLANLLGPGPAERAAEEATRMARHLARMNADAYLDLLAMSLGTLSSCQWEAGEPEPSVRTSAEAVQHAGRIPAELVAFEHSSIAAANVAHHLRELGRLPEALRYAHVSVTAARWLFAREHHDRHELLARALNAFGAGYAVHGDPARGSAAFTEAADILEARISAGTAIYGTAGEELLMVLQNASQAAEDSGDHAAARRQAERALRHALTFAGHDRDRFEAYLPGLAQRFRNLQMYPGP
jgi:hypothetical protein